MPGREKRPQHDPIGPEAAEEGVVEVDEGAGRVEVEDFLQTEKCGQFGGETFCGRHARETAEAGELRGGAAGNDRMSVGVVIRGREVPRPICQAICGSGSEERPGGPIGRYSQGVAGREEPGGRLHEGSDARLSGEGPAAGTDGRPGLAHQRGGAAVRRQGGVLQRGVPADPGRLQRLQRRLVVGGQEDSRPEGRLGVVGGQPSGAGEARPTADRGSAAAVIGGRRPVDGGRGGGEVQPQVRDIH